MEVVNQNYMQLRLGVKLTLILSTAQQGISRTKLTQTEIFIKVARILTLPPMFPHHFFLSRN